MEAQAKPKAKKLLIHVRLERDVVEELNKLKYDIKEKTGKSVTFSDIIRALLKFKDKVIEQ